VTIKNQVEGVLASVDKKIQSLCKESRSEITRTKQDRYKEFSNETEEQERTFIKNSTSRSKGCDSLYKR
jgi:hypothetical protein